MAGSVALAPLRRRLHRIAMHCFSVKSFAHCFPLMVLRSVLSADLSLCFCGECGAQGGGALLQAGAQRRHPIGFIGYGIAQAMQDARKGAQVDQAAQERPQGGKIRIERVFLRVAGEEGGMERGGGAIERLLDIQREPAVEGIVKIDGVAKAGLGIEKDVVGLEIVVDEAVGFAGAREKGERFGKAIADIGEGGIVRKGRAQTGKQSGVIHAAQGGGEFCRKRVQAAEGSAEDSP